MKSLFLSLLCLAILSSCKKSDDNNSNDNNPFLTAPPVSISLNLNLPQYNPLLFDGSVVVLTSEGIRGIVVYRKNDNEIFAYDLSDPNHVPSSCSRMQVEGVVASCPCTNDENAYTLSLFGLHQTDQELYPMLSYRALKSGNVITINN